MYWKILLPLWLLPAFSLCSCSVKEDRTVCPCVLELDFSGTDGDLLDSLSVSVLNGGELQHLAFVSAGRYGETYRIEVNKSMLMLNVYGFAGDSGVMWTAMTRHRSGIDIPQGDECPPVYLYSAAVDARAELHREKVVMRKNFCTVGITMVSEGECPFILEIDGNVSGYGPDGAPVLGRFIFSPDTDDAGRCSVRIPRQTDGSLRLRISDDDGVLRDFALGEYIIESGYDWTADDLEDVEIAVDYAKTGITFRIRDWEETIEFDIII